MHQWQSKLALILIYIVFAVLLNSVGTVILQVINNFGVSKAQASVLEGFKDLPIAFVSFLVASWLPKLGYRKAMQIALGLVAMVCVVMPLVPSFAMTKLLFFTVGVSFALVKVSVYSTVGLLTESPKQHASLLNTIEGFFMVGVLSGYWIFGFFIDSANPQSTAWFDVYWLLAGICVGAIGLLAATHFPSSEGNNEQSNTPLSGKQAYGDMFRLALRPLVLVFIIAAFFYVLVEQGIGTWLPTFNQEILKLPTALSIQMASVFAAALAAGRLLAGQVLQRVHWLPFLMACSVGMAALILVSLPLAQQAASQTASISSWQDVPLAGWLFPLIGLFMAPIYPAINSVVLSALPQQKHASMTGLIVVFSALGGTSGSLVTGLLFGYFADERAFYFVLVPLAVLLVAFWQLNKFSKQAKPITMSE